MNVLTLNIKQKYFDEIVAGIKKVETREIRPNNFRRYCRYLHEGQEYINDEDIPEDDSPVEVVPVKYDALKLITGEYKGKRPFVVVEVKDANVYFITDENGDNRTYEVNGKQYIMADIDYELGKIIEKSF